MKRSITAWYFATLPLLQGCVGLDNDGLSCDDGAAMLCGVLGVIAFLIAVIGDRKSGGLAIAGVILILA